MKTTLKILAVLLTVVILVVAIIGGRYLQRKQPTRSGTLDVEHMTAPVSVRYDERGVPHIQAQNEADMYRALGYVHAQDRLFQMEMLRRLARGELAAVLGPKLLESDRLFRTLGLAAHAERYVQTLDPQSPSTQALAAYLDGVNQYQDNHAAPLEFDLLGIPKRPFTAQDTVAITGYLAYSFAAAFKTEPVLTYIRDELGPEYLAPLLPEWNPLGATYRPKPNESEARLTPPAPDWTGLSRVASASDEAMSAAGLGLFQGSNAWVVSGQRTASGKPLLAGDPHIGFSVPAVWYEAHLSAPGFELYGHHLALNPFALLGHNNQFGWSLTLFENDDMDFVAETTAPQNPKLVWHQQQWVPLQERSETIRVKGAASVTLQLRSSPHGPIITDAFKDVLSDDHAKRPVALWWTFLQTPNPLLQAFYELNRANTRDSARAAASKIYAPGLNVLWASSSGDIAWWAAAKLPQRPAGVNPLFILDAQKGEAEKPGYYHFSFNPHEENPTRGYIVSANQQPNSAVPVPGYYLPADRAQRLDAQLSDAAVRWDMLNTQKLQLDTSNAYGPRMLQILLPLLQTTTTDPTDRAFLEPLEKWDGSYTPDSVAATLFSQLRYELAVVTFGNELDEAQFASLLRSPLFDEALMRLAADANSPWWDNVDTKAKETRSDAVQLAWTQTLQHLRKLYGTSVVEWSWGRIHTLTHPHPLGQKKPLHWLLNVGPFSVPGGRETPNNLAAPLGPAPWAVTLGPSTRRIIDFAHPEQSLGINPVGQSGVWLDRHYNDQAADFAQGFYQPQHLSERDVASHTQSTLVLQAP